MSCGHRGPGHRAAIVVVALALALATRLAMAQAPGGTIEERVLVDNDTVRVTLLVFPPGSASGKHVGLDPELGIVLEGELTILTPAGGEVLGPGQVRWLPALVPHDARNEGSLPLRFWVVIVKRRWPGHTHAAVTAPRWSPPASGGRRAKTAR